MSRDIETAREYLSDIDKGRISGANEMDILFVIAHALLDIADSLRGRN